MSAVPLFFQFRIHVFKYLISDERTQELMMASAGFVRSRDDRIDNL